MQHVSQLPRKLPKGRVRLYSCLPPCLTQCCTLTLSSSSCCFHFDLVSPGFPFIVTPCNDRIKAKPTYSSCHSFFIQNTMQLMDHISHGRPMSWRDTEKSKAALLSSSKWQCPTHTGSRHILRCHCPWITHDLHLGDPLLLLLLPSSHLFPKTQHPVMCVTNY
jgi:hypothetical protein